MKKNAPKAKRWLRWLGGCAVALIVAVCGFWYWINIPPRVKIPTPVMPQPNGYDYFLRARAAYVDDDNGVDEITDRKSTPGKVKRYPIAAKEAWLQRNAKAFHLLREGLKHPALHPRMQTKEYSHFRDLARALAVESHVRAARGDWNGAAESALDSIEFGYDIARGGPLIAGLVSNAVQAISLREMYQISPHLDAKASRAAAARMEHLYDGRLPYFKTMQVEKWGGQTELLNKMNQNGWRLRLIRTLSNPTLAVAMLQMMDSSYTPPSRVEIARLYLKNSPLLITTKRQLLQNYTKMMDAYIANGRLPYVKMQPMPESGDPATRIMNSAFKDSRWNWARMDAYNVLNLTMLALRAFHLEKGHYPANLKELVPEYLTKVPDDPFAGDAPLRYQLDGTKYLLWSIGADGVDNHGTPVINRDRPDAARYRLMDPDSKGDVVAGINMP